jgi:hypothetical protein
MIPDNERLRELQAQLKAIHDQMVLASERLGLLRMQIEEVLAESRLGKDDRSSAGPKLTSITSKKIV